MKKRSLIIATIILVSLCAVPYFFLRPAFRYVSDYLSKSESVTAEILVVEGWLPHQALETAYNEYRKGRYKYVVTTGIKYIPSYYKISDNGYLIFYTRDLLAGSGESGAHSIEIEAYSDMGGKNRAHFNFFVNDSLKDSFYVGRRKKAYSIKWTGCLKDIDSVMVQYDNDVYDPPLDRNLSVKEISFDNKIKVPYLFHSEYDMLKLDGKLRFKNNITSSAQLARTRLISLGIDSMEITSVAAENAGINRTLTSALAFRDWLSRHGNDISGINIITLGSHARRTWMTYNRILNEKYRIGIISIPEESGNQISGYRKAFKTIRETLGIIYYWFILIPY